MTVRDAIVEKGQLVLKEPLPLPDGTRVKIRVELSSHSPLLDIASNAVDMGVSDAAEQHNHYIYGAPEETK